MRTSNRATPPDRDAGPEPEAVATAPPTEPVLRTGGRPFLPRRRDDRDDGVKRRIPQRVGTGVSRHVRFDRSPLRCTHLQAARPPSAWPPRRRSWLSPPSA